MNFSLAKELVSLEIIKIALLEGATFFGFILIIIDNSLVGLILGVVLILVSIATFPTSTRFLQRLESLKFRVGL
jgi:general stress protein CsbA